MDNSSNHKLLTLFEIGEQELNRGMLCLKIKLANESQTIIKACDKEDNIANRDRFKANYLKRLVQETLQEQKLSYIDQESLYVYAQGLLKMHVEYEEGTNKNNSITPIIEAACCGSVEIIKFCISNGADVNESSSTGNTPLMFACGGGHVETIKELLSLGANIEHYNKTGINPLMTATRSGKIMAVKILIEHGASIYAHCSLFNALRIACHIHHLEMVRLLLDAGSDDHEHKEMNMYSALVEASANGNIQIASFLLDSGSHVHMLIEDLETPLKAAALGGHFELAYMLVSRGANIEEATDDNGHNPVLEDMLEVYKKFEKFIELSGTIGTGTKQSVDQIPGAHHQSTIPQTAGSATDEEELRDTKQTSTEPEPPLSNIQLRAVQKAIAQMTIKKKNTIVTQ